MRIVAVKANKTETGLEFQQRWLATKSDPRNRIVTSIRLVDIGKFKGVEWDGSDALNAARENGTAVHHTLSQGQSAIFFLNDRDHVAYSIFANSETAAELGRVARSTR